MPLTYARPELELTRRDTGSPSEGTHELVRTATAIGGFEDTCDFIMGDYATHTLAINAMIVYVGSIGGGLVHLNACPLGVTQYDISAPIVDGGYGSIIFEGEGVNTNLRVINAAGIINVIHITSVDSWTVRDLGIDGNVANNPEDPGVGNQQCGVFYDIVNFGYIENVYIQNMPQQSIRIEDSLDCSVHACTGINAGRRAVELTRCVRVVISSCHSRSCGLDTFRVEGAAGASTGCIFINCTSLNDFNGFGSDALCTLCIFAHNYAITPTQHGFQLAGQNFVIDGNTVENPGDRAFKGLNIDNSVISNNNFMCGNLQILQLVTSDLNAVVDNIFEGDDVATGVRIETGCTGNLLHPNRYLGTFTTRMFTDDGTGTIIGSITCQLWQAGGGAAEVDGGLTDPSGIDIDAADETATGHRILPPHVQQSERIRIYGYSNVIEANNNMLLRIIVGGGSSSQQWDSDLVDVADHPSEETGGIVVGDVLHWILVRADDTDVDDLVGGDFLQIMAVGEGATVPDIATDALFGDAMIEYV